MHTRDPGVPEQSCPSACAMRPSSRRA